MSSQDFNDILEKTQNKIVTMNNEVSALKKNMEIKLKVISYEMEYLNSTIDKLSNIEKQDGKYILLDSNKEGLYECFGNNVHAYFKTKPINIFNIIPINSSDVYYKEEAKVKINGAENEYYNNILKEDTVKSKEIYFEEKAFINDIISQDSAEYLNKDNRITISVEKDKEKSYGYSKFNIIEIDPYLVNSFDIEKILIYDVNDVTPTITLEGINNVNKTRILLDKKYNFNKVEFIINPKFITERNGEKIIPFGLKHIYFLNADFRNDSYIELEYNSDEFIDYITNKVNIYTPEGIVETTLTEQGIKVYLDKINGVLTTEQEPTNNIRKTISRNVNKLYFYVPIGQSSNTISAINSIYAFKFFITHR
jgi:hypothetical protein